MGFNAVITSFTEGNTVYLTSTDIENKIITQF